MNHFVIDSHIKIGQIHLRVYDIEQSVDFYESILGLKQIESSTNEALLSTTGRAPYLVALHKSKDRFDPTQRRKLGLYHFAVLVPQRSDLADFFIHLQENQNNVKIDGFADHAVSEAIYIRDPDYNGIEIYRDRPSSEWIWQQDTVKMANYPLQFAELVQESTGQKWKNIPQKTIIGHIHLHVSSLQKSKMFYSELLGIPQTASIQGAVFFGAGGYHHHIATNTWVGENTQVQSKDLPGLDHFTIEFPNQNALQNMLENLASHNIVVQETYSEIGESFSIYDQDNTILSLYSK